MSASLQRSKSALSICLAAALSPHHEIDEPPKPPPLRRARSAVARTATSPLRLIHSPLGEGEEDPFSLSSFFPPHLHLITNDRKQWKWLQHHDGDEDSQWSSAHSGFTSPITEDNEWLSTTPSDMSLMEDEEYQTTDIITPKDKLNAELPSASAPRDGIVLDDHLLSPYYEDGPTDDEGLYCTLSSLRKAHSARPQENHKPPTTLDDLFSPRTDGGVGGLDDSHGWLLYRGMWRVIDFLDSRF